MTKPLRVILPAVLPLALAAEPADMPENYDESKAGTLPLPALFEKETTAFSWMNSRRGEILKQFETLVYGPIPGRPETMEFKTVAVKEDAAGGLATRKEIDLVCTNRGKTVTIPVLLYLPNNAKTPAGAFVNLNFMGNHGETTEEDVRLSGRRNPDRRGKNARRLPLELLMKSGYAVITACNNDLYPDEPTGAPSSIYRLYHTDEELAAGHFPAISAWAWGCQRLLDCLENEPRVDVRRIGVLGHSRLGKTALWAGVNDPRFRWVISNDSGCVGASLTRRNFGESVEIITHRFPYWFQPSFKEWAGREGELPVDQHMLLALAAPRGLYVASASEDLWADPRGEFLSLAEAAKVYRLFGSEGIGTTEMPGIEQPILSDCGYHLRNGKHDLLEYDWQQFIAFADRFR